MHNPFVYVVDTHELPHASVYRYVGLSSTGMSYKSSSASYGGSNFQSNNRYGGFSGRYDDDSYKSKDDNQFGEEKFEKFVPKSHHGASSERKTSNYSR